MAKVFRAMMVVALLLTGCVSTQVQEEWMDPAYRGRGAQSLIVLGLPAGSETGSACMDEFTRQLSERGVSATAGYGTAPAAASKEGAMARARETGADSVLVCRFLRKETQLDIYPVENESMLLGDIDMWGPNEYVQNEYQVFGTVLYDAVTGKALWSAVSDTSASGSQRKMMKSYVGTMLRQMQDRGVLGVHRKR